jgi:hypothetical protein
VLAAHARASGGRLWGVGKRLCAQRGRLRGWEEHPEAPLPSPFQTAPQRAANQSRATTRWGWTSARGCTASEQSEKPWAGRGAAAARNGGHAAEPTLGRLEGAQKRRKHGSFVRGPEELDPQGRPAGCSGASGLVESERGPDREEKRPKGGRFLLGSTQRPTSSPTQRQPHRGADGPERYPASAKGCSQTAAGAGAGRLQKS